MVNEINHCSQKDGVGFATTRRGIDKAAFAVDNMLPGIFLEREGAAAFQ